MIPRRIGAAGWVLSLGAWTLALLLLVLPLVSLLAEALRQGVSAALDALRDDDARSAIRLSALVVACAVPINTLCGLFAAYLLSRFRFAARGLLLVLIELPLSVSPVVSGLVWVLVFGVHGWFGPALVHNHVQIIFALPGILLATLFVTFPFVVRTIMPVLEAQGGESEEAAAMLGAGFLSSFLRVTLPGIGWALLSGVLLCSARALGEFGAVSVVSGHIPGVTETVPLRIETLYNDYQSVDAFALAALLAILSALALGLRGLLEWRHGAAG